MFRKMHNPNYKNEDPNKPPEHDPKVVNEYFKEDPEVPGDPDKDVIDMINGERNSRRRPEEPEIVVEESQITVNQNFFPEKFLDPTS